MNIGALQMVKCETESLFETEQADSSLGGNDKYVGCRHIVRVAFESGADKEFDYLLPDKLWPVETGQRVEVPFGRGNKLQIGFCVETKEGSKNKLK